MILVDFFLYLHIIKYIVIMADKIVNFPPQRLSFKAKNKAWRKKHLDWCDSKTFFHSSPVRKSVLHKKINYDLLNGKLHMSDLMAIVNPEHIQANFIPDNIQHYPIMNAKLNLLKGEESDRAFEYKVVVTNPNALSQIEEDKKNEILNRLQEVISNRSLSEEQFNQEIEKIGDYYTYEWQDMREIRANALLQHYSKEQNFDLMFNNGFMDAMAIGEEMYQCDIVGGEPVVQKLNPLKVRIYRSGYSNKIEDADVIILEDYWSPGKIIDTYYDVLSDKDVKYIENMPDTIGRNTIDEMDTLDERDGFINVNMLDETFPTVEGGGYYFDPMNLFGEGTNNSLLPFDMNGNIRVIKMYWKSMRRIKKIKSYDPSTGEEVYNFYPENYIPNKAAGEEETILYINEAWEGVKIGEDIYVNMRPRPIQYNRLTDVSRCHFGIIGSIYNIADSKPFSMVDMMKHYNYMYDVIHDRLNKMMARNWGKLVNIDLSKVPKGWDIDKWMYFAKVNGLYITDSFNEGNYGAATGKLAGALNNASNGIIDAEFGNSIQSQINLLEFIKMEMSEIVGITKQREGQVSNRETVGGVERATLQSSHITEWLFTIHNDVKKRVIECFLETAKIAMKGRNMKFNYILSDNSMQIMNIDGDEFAECDYGLVVDYSKGTQQLKQQIESLAQAALQNQTLSFSTIMKLYNSSSLMEKQRMVEKDEQAMQQRAQQAQQAELQSQQQIEQMRQQTEMAKLEQEDALNARDNDTKIVVATIGAQARQLDDLDGIEEPDNDFEREKLKEEIRQFNSKLDLEKQKLGEQKRSNLANESIKRKQANRRPVNAK